VWNSSQWKTCLSQLLRDYYHKEGRKAFLITDWEKLDSENPWGSFIEFVKKIIIKN